MAFLPKYFAELGMTDGRIGILTSIPSVIALIFMPLIGALSDRVPKKRDLLAAGLLLTALTCAFAARCLNFWPLLISVCAYMIFSTSASPLATVISLEYCREIKRPYGPIRLMGTVGYQAGALLVGALLTVSLRSLYPLMGAALIVSCAITFLMPNVEGHQHNRQKVPLRTLFADRHVCILLGMILFATISSQFYMSFFTKHLGDLGMNNQTVSIITFVSVLPEIPFLLFGDRLAKRGSIWTWVVVGMALNGARWLGLSVCKTTAPIILFQLLGVSVMACFEFMPAFYLSRRVPAEQTGAAQSMLTLTSFGVGKIIGSLLGGLICQRTGIPAVFAFNGAALLIGALFLIRPARRLIRAEKAQNP